jgi:hypothetical protein
MQFRTFTHLVLHLATPSFAFTHHLDSCPLFALDLQRMITRFACLPLVATLALSLVVTKAAGGSVPRGVSPSSNASVDTQSSGERDMDLP